MKMTEAAMEARAPAIFAETHRMTEVYRQVRTIDVIRRLADVGYYPVQVGQDNPTKRDKRFVTHMAVLRHEDTFAVCNQVGPEIPQIVIMNSHNGRKKLSLMGGIYRFVCSNGLFIGDHIMQYSGRHFGGVIDEALSFAGLLSERMPLIQQTIEDWSAKELSPTKATEFARSANILRWGEISSYDPATLLKPRRAEDESRDLWRVFNVVQENCCAGGVSGQNANSRAVTSKPFTQINRSIDFNRQLWDLAEQYA